MLTLRRFVPRRSWLLISLLTIAGCYDMHGVGSDAGRDAREGSDAFWSGDALILPYDTAPSRDGGPSPDAGEFCAPRAVDVSCTRSGTAGAPIDLPVYLAAFGGCYCGERINCAATVTGAVIDLETSVCHEILCEACLPSIEGSCSLPALAEGVYRVRINGADAFDFPVTLATSEVPANACHATPGPVGCGPAFEPALIAPDSVCLTDRSSSGGPIPVRITNGCGGCGATPTCEAVVIGSDVSIHPQELPTMCLIACEDECTPVESTCFIPPLADGHYDLRVEGMPGSTSFDIGEGLATDPVCLRL